jgi:glycosyltransferase involved in cell wall biosynthesis
MQSLTEGLPVICYDIRGNNDLIKDNYNGFFIKSYKDVPNKIHCLNLDNFFFNKMRYNALKTITKDFLKKKVNFKIYNIVKKII